MIQVYDSGAAFITENQTFLDTNPQISAFMVLDAPLLKETGKINYAMKCEKDEKTLLAMKVEPYNLIRCSGLDQRLSREGNRVDRAVHGQRGKAGERRRKRNHPRHGRQPEGGWVSGNSAWRGQGESAELRVLDKERV